MYSANHFVLYPPAICCTLFLFCKNEQYCDWVFSLVVIPRITIIILLSVLWRCWLGGRKGIRPVKNRVVGYWRGYLSGARCRLAYGPADATATHLSLASVKSRLVLPFQYRLTWVVPEKGLLNRCVCVILRITAWCSSCYPTNTAQALNVRKYADRLICVLYCLFVILYLFLFCYCF